MHQTEVIVEPGRQDIVISRTFDAPPAIVFKAMTDPKLIPGWWGPRSLTTTVDQLDLRYGGTWRYVQRDAAGNEHAFRGVYHDVVPGQRCISTFEWEGLPGHVALDTVTLEAVADCTRYVSVSVFQSIADRDGMVRSGMESGARESIDRLAEVIAGQRTPA
jgi:uncharacterized protein YndB with AHSA1/START domain